MGDWKLQPSPCARGAAPELPLDITHIYPWAVKAGASGQVIVLDPQERRTVADCDPNA